MKVVGAGESGVRAGGSGDANPDIANSRGAWGCGLKKQFARQLKGCSSQLL